MSVRPPLNKIDIICRFYEYVIEKMVPEKYKYLKVF
jgi:hypothetical protein